MIIFQSDYHNFLIITEKRTASSFLRRRFAEVSELQMWDISKDHQAMLQKILEENQNGRKVYLVCREPTTRRRGSMPMFMEGNTLEHKIMYMRGLIDSTQRQYYLNPVVGFIDFTLGDEHLDWGTSAFYYVLVAAGIKFQKLLARTNKFLDGYSNSWDHQTSLSTFLINNYKQFPSVLDFLKEWGISEDISESPSKEITGLETESVICYNVYAQELRYLHNGINSYLLAEGDPFEERIMSFDTWTNLECLMFSKFEYQENTYDKDKTTIKDARLTLYRVLYEINKYYDQHEILLTYNDSSYPCKRLLNFYPDINQTLAYLKTDLDIPPLEENKDPSIKLNLTNA